jgi:tetratricopeptide (TPR) repeat protein
MSFLMESSTTPKPNVSLKSAKSIGQEMSLLTATQDATVSLKNKIVSFFTPLFFGLIMILLLLLIFKQRLSRLSRGSSLNNNGFVFLHKGLTDLAEKLLFRAIAKGEDACHPIANYASCLAIKGETEAAMQYISAADFLARSPHEKAVVALNWTIILLLRKDNANAKNHLEEALKLSRKEIIFYCRNSEEVLMRTKPNH